jgi:hypothetical protein
LQADKTKSFQEYEVPRASSLPRNPVKRSLPNLMTSSMTSSFSSSQNIWSPDGKCPSFADILKRATGSEEALEQSEKAEVSVTRITTTKLEDEGISAMGEDIHPEASNTESLTISHQIHTSTRIPEGFGSVPCLTQEKQSDAENVSRPPRKSDNDSKHISQSSTMASSNSLSLFSDNDKVVVSEVAVLEPSISQTVQIQNTESEVIKIELTKGSVNDNSRSSTDELAFIDKPNKSSSDDNISISSQKTSRFGAIKSYANILSGGLKKVGSVFGRKPKEEQANKKEKQNAESKTESSDSSKSFKENYEPKPVIVNQTPKSSSTEKPEIPGLLFKTDLERRPSKKKRRSRPSSTFDIEGRVDNVDNVHIDSKNIESVKQDEERETKIESTSAERKAVVLQEEYEEIRITENDKTNSMRRRNSKKKKKESTPSMKFNDEIDQALHEIKLMDTEEKNKAKENTNSLKRRPSKKSKKSSDHTDELSKEEFRKPLTDSDTGNIADDEADKEKKKASGKLENHKPKPSFSVEKEKEKVPVRITSSFSCERLESLPEIKGDATRSHTNITLAERKQKSYSLNQDSSSYSFSIPDEEEIECLKEDTVIKDIISKKTSIMSSTSSEIKNIKTSETKKEVTKDVKPAIADDKIQEKPKETKPAIVGLPMEDASNAWMNDDFGTMDSEEECSIKSLEKEKKIIKEKIQEFEEKLSVKSVPSAFAGLPVVDVSDAWMNDDFVKIEDDEAPQDTCNRPTSPKSLSKDDSISDYDENDKETQMYAVPAEVEGGKVKEGRLSAIEEAKRFSCDDDEENQFTAVAEVVKDVHICDDDESTSWAFVASKEPLKLDETPNTTRNLSTSSNPALIVEIIEKVPKQDSMDPDGYKVIKGKTKTRDKRKSKEVPETSIEAIISQLDQPIETQRVSLQTDENSSTCTEDFEIIEKGDGDERISNSQEEKSKEIKKTEEPDNSTIDSNANFVTDDPWLAVKEEYTRKESSTNNKTESTENAGYTIEVKVSTKETCLGRRLHEREETEWKMDVQCTQKNTMPDIIEGHDGNNFTISPNAKDSKTTYKADESDKKFNSLPRLKTKALSPDRLCLSPSWMRKDLSRTQSVESNIGNEGGIFGSVKDRKFSDSRTSCFTSSAETLDEHEDDVYWRLKHKVKKKKRRNQSGPSDAKSRENNELLFSSTKDLLEPLSAEPIIETKEESLNSSNQSIISNSSINTIEEMKSETIKAIDASITKTSTAHVSMEQPNRKVSTSQKGIPYEKLMSMEMDALRKESVSPVQIDKESSISVALESVAESNMKSDFSESIKMVKTSVTNEEMHLANTPQLEIKTDESQSVATPSIVLENEAESKMVGATEIIRATSPMLNKPRPEFKRQNSKEMQQAVEVQRPLSFERQTTLSTSLTTDNIADAWVNETHGSIDDDEMDKELDDRKKRSSWSSIAATVVSKVAKTKNEGSTRKISKHETLV